MANITLRLNLTQKEADAFSRKLLKNRVQFTMDAPRESDEIKADDKVESPRLYDTDVSDTNNITSFTYTISGNSLDQPISIPVDGFYSRGRHFECQ